MHIIARRPLSEFAAAHPNTRSALEHWYRLVKAGTFNSLAEVRAVFPGVDQVGGLTVFNIAGNQVRLVAAIHYYRQKVFFRAILIHSEYDKRSGKSGRCYRRILKS